MNDFRFVLLMRHAKHGTGRAPAEESPTDSHLREIALPLGNLTTTSNPPSQTSAPAQGELSDDGKIETEAVAQRVKEYTGEWGEPLKVVAIFHADSAEAKATAVIVHQEFSDATLQKADCLTPKIAFDTEVFKKAMRRS